MSQQAGAFALIGDRFHNSDYIRSALGMTLVREAGLPVNFTDEPARLSAATLSRYPLFILFRDAYVWPEGYGPDDFCPGMQIRDPARHAFDTVDSYYPGYRTLAPLPQVGDPPLPDVKAAPVAWMTAEQGRAVKAFVAGGGSVLFYHNATYNGAVNADLREVLGAATEHHPPLRPFTVRVTRRDHPITRGVGDFVVTDEQHFMTYDKAPECVFMRSVNEDGLTHRHLGSACEAGWAYEYGNGRVCYLAPGHTLAALRNPEYVKIQHNAVRWLLRRDGLSSGGGST
ncbi:MAG: ThuA domain-containing protein [Kiritimatiellae bacterium]|nr:ThuA domain-containing protein [Kiritimatiellia bacterium]